MIIAEKKSIYGYNYMYVIIPEKKHVFMDVTTCRPTQESWFSSHSSVEVGGSSRFIWHILYAWHPYAQHVPSQLVKYY